MSGFAVLVAGCSLLIADSRTVQALSSANAPAVAWSSGVIRIDGMDHSGSGNLLPGVRLETLRSGGQLYLADGTRMRLAAATKLRVQSQSVSLEGGVARIDSVPAPNRRLHIVAGELEVNAGGGVIARPRAAELIVTAALTATEVRHRNGVLVAMVRPGETLSFSVASVEKADQAEKSMDTRMTGKVWGEKGRYFLNDEVTSLKSELQGGRTASFEGMRVQVRGELVHAGVEGRRTLLVKEYAMAQAKGGATKAGQSGTGSTASEAGAGTGSGSSGGAAAAGSGTGAGAGSGAGGAAAGGAAAGAGLSTSVIVGITVAALAGVGASLALVSISKEQSISQ